MQEGCSGHTVWFDWFSENVRQSPEQKSFTVLTGDMQESASFTNASLLQAVVNRARILRSRVSVGQRAIIFLSQDREYLISFMACLYAGVVAVPVCMARPGSRFAEGLEHIFEDCAPSLFITDTRSLALYDRHPLAVPILNVDEAKGDDVTGLPDFDHVRDPDAVAFLQYTSGSTSLPKGVKITQANFAANQHALKQVFHLQTGETTVSWLPLYHDMGLANAMLAPFSNAHCVLMCPRQFTRRPLSWLRAVSKYHAVHSGAPDFAYRLVADVVNEDEVASLDLGNWRTAFNGAEPVRHSTLERFSTVFASAGFKASAITPCYGMAEVVVGVSCKPADKPLLTIELDEQALAKNKWLPAGPATQRRLTAVSSGTPLLQTDICICDPDSDTPLGEHCIGEILVRSPSVSAGYWNNESATQAVFGRSVGGHNDYFRTGDLGFIHQGELFVSGRIKDLIIMRGRNIHPADVEQTIEDLQDGLHGAISCAFSASGGDEEILVMITEVRRSAARSLNYPELAKKLATAIVQSVGVLPGVLMFIKEGGLPRTTSGKIQRQKTALWYSETRFDPIFVWKEPVRTAICGEQAAQLEAASRLASEYRSLRTLVSDREAGEIIESYLLHMIGAVTGRSLPQYTDAQTGLFDLGIDSMQVLNLIECIDTDFAVCLTTTELFEQSLVERIATLVDQKWIAANAEAVAQDKVSDGIKLSNPESESPSAVEREIANLSALLKPAG